MDNLSQAERQKMLFLLALKNVREYYRDEEVVKFVENEIDVFSDEGLYRQLKRSLFLIKDEFQSVLRDYVHDDGLSDLDAVALQDSLIKRVKIWIEEVYEEI